MLSPTCAVGSSALLGATVEPRQQVAQVALRAESAKGKAYRTYDDAFRILDSESWEVLKVQAIAHFRDHRPGQLKHGCFNQLNESFAYRHLVRQGYSQVRILPELGKRVPDLQYFDGRLRRHCEVKTMNISNGEISRRSSGKAFSNVYLHLGDGFIKKVSIPRQSRGL